MQQVDAGAKLCGKSDTFGHPEDIVDAAAPGPRDCAIQIPKRAPIALKLLESLVPAVARVDVHSHNTRQPAVHRDAALRVLAPQLPNLRGLLARSVLPFFDMGALRAFESPRPQ